MVGALSDLLFLSPVHPLRSACFGFGHFLRFLAPLSSYPFFFSFSVHFAFLFHALVSQESSSASSLPPPYSSSVGSSPLPLTSAVFMGLLLQLWGCAMGPCPPFWSPLLGVRLCWPRTLCVLSSSSGHGGSWLWCLLMVLSWFLLVVGAIRVFIPFVVFVSFFWFPSLSAVGECLGGVHSSFRASIFVLS